MIKETVTKKKKMKQFTYKALLGGGALLSSVASVSAFAQPSQFDVTCEGIDDVRQVLVIAPGVKGKACDVIYTRDRGVNVTTPYFANTDVNYCMSKAALLRDKLKSSNYSCLGAGQNFRAQKVATQNVTGKPSNETLNGATSSSNTSLANAKVSQNVSALTKVENAQATPVANATSASKVAVQSLATSASNQQEANANSAQEVQNGLSKREEFLRRLELSQQQESDIEKARIQAQLDGASGVPDATSLSSKTVSQPLVEPSVPAVPDAIKPDATKNGNLDNNKIGPVALITPQPITQNAASKTSKVQNSPAKIVSDSKISSGASGKFVGATPVLLSSNVTTNNNNLASTAAGFKAAGIPLNDNNKGETKKSSSLLPKAFTRDGSNKIRPREQIIKSTLIAQAAAWNEGNIEAFMGSYWRDDDLRFVSGTEVTKGWSSTLRRYKERYGDGEKLGTLKFEGMDIQMITDDVAIIVGRFHLTREAAVDTGVFTLVMKSIDGAWRIVHDHTVADMPEEG